MNSSSNQQGDPGVAPRVSILVENGNSNGVGGSSATDSGIGRLRVDDDDTAAGQGEGGMSPSGSDLAMDDAGRSGPTAIPADEGDVSADKVVAVETVAGLDAAAVDVDTVTPREGDNVATDGGNDEEQEEDGEEEENEDADDDDDESEYEYEYEDEDQGHYSGFLIPTEPIETNYANNNNNATSSAAGGSDVNVVAAEDIASAGAASASAGGEAPRTMHRAVSRLSESGRSTPMPETNPPDERKQKWREPTRAAVNMSLRAEKEKTGGRRRLASDLYKIMMADTIEAGFSLEPADEDSMEKWRISLFGFDEDSNLAKDLMVCNNDNVELEMSFPDQYPFEPPFVRVVKPRFKRQTGFVMSGALCMELLTKDGWNPINDIESVIVSIRSLMVVGDGRLQAAVDMGKEAYKKALGDVLAKRKAEKAIKSAEDEAAAKEEDDNAKMGEAKRKRAPSDANDDGESKPKESVGKKATGGSYSAAEAQSAYDHLSKYHKKEGWDKSGWWSRKG